VSGLENLDEAVGYQQPPRAGRFRKGQSGNPQGRPRNRHRHPPHDTVLGQMVTVRENGRDRRITAAEAFILHLTRKGLAGDNNAARAALAAIEKARPSVDLRDMIDTIRICAVGSGADAILEPLGIGRKKFATDETRMRWQLEPWIVEAALDRLGERQLSETEQREVWSNTRTPHKVRWPQWWSVRT